MRLAEIRLPTINPTAMAAAQRHRTDPLSDPAPATPSDESIREAEALREALRRKLLKAVEREVQPYWTVGAD